MVTLAIVVAVVVLLVVFVAFWLTGIYNNLVVLKNRFKNAFAQIDVQLKRRYDLIPNLVEAAKGYMVHEKETLTLVIEARNKAAAAREAVGTGGAAAVASLGAADQALTGVMTKFMALSENYPDLMANTNVQTLMEELSSTENKVSFARQAYNDAVMAYNIAVQSFPTSLFAAAVGMTEAALLEVISHDAERAAPKVSFS